MIERGTGRTSGLTDWQLMDVNSMWACLQDHDTANHWKQVAGWRKVCDLAQTHLGRLQQYRRGLAEAWPPETSAASRTYLAELDELIDKVQRTHDAAAANYTALSAATQAIGTTRAALGKIYEEYATKFQQKQAYESMVADPKAVMGNRATAPPVADGELERLNVQARSMMFNLSGELQQAQATLQKPPAARPPVQSGDPDALTAIPTAPIIPPIIPMPMPTAGNRTASRIAAPDVATPIPQAQGVGPVLGGAGNGLTNNPNTVNTGSAVPPTSAAHPGLGPLPPNAPISPVHITPPSAGGHAPAGSLNRPQALPPAPPARSSPPNGVIGGMPSGGVAPLGPNAAQSRKVNPIGGVIGGGGAGTGPTGGAGSRPGSSRTFTSSNVGPTPIGGAPSLGGNSGIGLPPARHRQQPQFDLDSSRPWDPDNPWETDQGGEPNRSTWERAGPNRSWTGHRFQSLSMGLRGTLTTLCALLAMAPPAVAPAPSSAAALIRREQWHLDYLKITKAQGISRGNGVVVAVPDTGVDPHPDLRNNLLPGTDVIPGGNGDGRRDLDSHGTSMAGLIAAHGQGADSGALGVAPESKILPIFDSPPNGDGQPDELAQGIDYAIANGADIISISSVGGSSSRLREAIRRALEADIVVVAGVGNLPRDQIVGYPASEEGVIAVGGVDRAGQHAAISVTGPKIDVVAPAIDIYSTSYGGKYSKGTGTSSATAIVAGAAALIRSKYPYLPAREVAHRLTATAVDKGPPGRDDEYGYGVIDLVAALTADVPPLGFESVSAPAGAGPTTTAGAQPGDESDGATARGLATLGVIVAVGVGWALIARRRRRGDDPPPRISR